MMEDQSRGPFYRFDEPDPILRDLFDRVAVALEQKIGASRRINVSRRNAIFYYLHEACGTYASDLDWRPTFSDLPNPSERSPKKVLSATRHRMIEVFSRISKRFHESNDARLRQLILDYVEFGISNPPRYPDYGAHAVAEAFDRSSSSPRTVAALIGGVTPEQVIEWHFQLAHNLMPGFVRQERAKRVTPRNAYEVDLFLD